MSHTLPFECESLRDESVTSFCVYVKTFFLMNATKLGKRTGNENENENEMA